MIRRRRPTREIPFSFDSFLDVVANVVGIIIRLILVTWVGARSYTGLMPSAMPPPPPAYVEETLKLPELEDPLAPELERQKQELALAQAQLLEQFRSWEQEQGERKLTEKELAELTQHIYALSEERGSLERAAAERGQTGQAVALSLAEIQQRSKRLTAEFEALRNAPSEKKTHRYRTPVSHPLQTEEIMFECCKGRVTLIDIGAFQDEIQRAVQARADKLRASWEVSDLTPPIGAFRLRYRLERPHGLSEVPGGQTSWDLSWEVEPLYNERGETVEQALAKSSAFRKVIDALDPNQTAVTFFVYPDSFTQYRQLRDYLHDRDITVAGRPQPPGAAISAGRNGTASRGQ
jgi:hypothetical protein